MTVDEIYSEIAAHMIKGMMMHEQMANYYDFLGLKGYKCCHEFHYLTETCSYRALCRYFINHHNKLIPEKRIENPKIIPDIWYKHTRFDVDPGTKRNSVKIGLTKWVEWERDTKKLYEQMYANLLELGEVASAIKIKELICDVDQELKKAERYLLNKETIGYDLVEIISEQQSEHVKYTRKINKSIFK